MILGPGTVLELVEDVVGELASPQNKHTTASVSPGAQPS